MIYFKTIRWRNFLSTGNVFSEVKLNSHSNTLIIGENGAGKSTILDAICFALYNKPFRNINKPQLVNTINKKDMLVEIEFSIGKNEYKVRRGIKPGVFEVLQNDVLLNQDAAARDYQETLETQILKLNYKSFCQVVILGSASFVPFMQLPLGQRREIIEDLLDLQIFSKMNVLLKEKNSTLNSQLREVGYQLDIATEKLSLQEEHIKTIKKNLDKQIEENNAKIKAARENIDREGKAVADLSIKIDELYSKIVDHDKVKAKLAKLQRIETQVGEKIIKLEKEVGFFENHDNCPTCKQEIDEEFKCSTVESRKKQIEETKSGCDLLSNELKQIQDQLTEYEKINSEIIDLNMKVMVINSNITNQNNYISELIRDNENLNKDQGEVDQNKIEELKKQIKELKKQKEDGLNTLELYKAAGLILKDTGIKAQIIKQYVPIINKLINKYLAALDFFVNFELDENFNETIKSRFRDEFSYASFSEGEKMRINLAILFTWRAVAKLRNSASTNLLIMDEIFDGSLDSTGTEEFLKILEQLTNDTNTFIISHKTDALLDKFESILRFEKHHNFSRMAA